MSTRADTSISKASYTTQDARDELDRRGITPKLIAYVMNIINRKTVKRSDLLAHSNEIGFYARVNYTESKINLDPNHDNVSTSVDSAIRRLEYKIQEKQERSNETSIIKFLTENPQFKWEVERYDRSNFYTYSLVGVIIILVALVFVSEIVIFEETGHLSTIVLGIISALVFLTVCVVLPLFLHYRRRINQIVRSGTMKFAEGNEEFLQLVVKEFNAEDVEMKEQGLEAKVGAYGLLIWFEKIEERREEVSMSIGAGGEVEVEVEVEGGDYSNAPE